MTTTEPRVVQPGEPAPDFTLPAVHRDGMVSLADYRGRSPLLLAFFRGIYYPFCRRQIAKLGLARDMLLETGIETLAVVASDLERTGCTSGTAPRVSRWPPIPTSSATEPSGSRGSR